MRTRKFVVADIENLVRERAETMEEYFVHRVLSGPPLHGRAKVEARAALGGSCVGLRR
jgi:hypothetical protein